MGPQTLHMPVLEVQFARIAVGNEDPPVSVAFVFAPVDIGLEQPGSARSMDYMSSNSTALSTDSVVKS